MLAFELNVDFQQPASHEVSRTGSLQMSCDSEQHALRLVGTPVKFSRKVAFRGGG